MDIALKGKRTLVIGLGIEGVDLVRYAVAEGAVVTANDAKPESRLRDRMTLLAGLPVHYALGNHDPALAGRHDLLLVSQGVPLRLPLILEARRLGRPIASLTGLFLSRCPGPIAGISGSSGKTTTTALVDAMFTAAGVPHLTGGNIGVPLLSRLGEIDPQTWTVLEISHSQLELTDRSPHVAAITNVTPNHLDRYNWEAYVQLKRNLVAFQTGEDIAVLNYDNGVARSFSAATAATVHYTTAASTPAPGDGAYLRSGVVMLRRGGQDGPILPAADIPLRGSHNVENVLTATATAAACGIGPEAMAAAVRGFAGVPHRIEAVATIDGVTWVNDSIATTPERTLAGMRSFTEPLVLLLGGREKNLPLEELAREAAKRCRAIICFGEARDLLAAAVKAAGSAAATAATLADTVALAARRAQSSDVVLLSPACTSFDAYDNFERRGEEFRALVRALRAGIDGEVRS